MVTMAASFWLRSALAVRSTNSRSSSWRIVVATSRIVLPVLPAAASRTRATAPSGWFCLTNSISAVN